MLTSTQPLTFVTSIFGMTNMQEYPTPLWPFGVTLVAICVPFFSIIGFLSTKYGYRMWARKTSQLWHWVRGKKPATESGNADDEGTRQMVRSLSSEQSMGLRLKEQEMGRGRSNHRPSASHPNILQMVESMGEGRPSGLERMGTVIKFGNEEEAKCTKKACL
jgi:hypothetical protein